MSEIELKPCPYQCDGKPAYEVDDEEFAIARVICTKCGAAGPYVDLADHRLLEKAKAAAARLWNTRSQSERVSRLEEERDSALVRLYHHDPMEVARLCDEEFDRSGALLGRIRKRARSALNQGADDGR